MAVFDKGSTFCGWRVFNKDRFSHVNNIYTKKTGNYLDDEFMCEDSVSETLTIEDIRSEDSDNNEWVPMTKAALEGLALNLEVSTYE
jgi:hypothetical protein